ncbi:MAG TPA: hypothetical protein VGM31_20930 [Puia sp.]
MKTLFYPALALTLVLASCHKSIHDTGVAGSWLLVKKTAATGSHNSEVAPAADSAVTLALTIDGIYTSRLNNHEISHGTFVITKDVTPGYNHKTIELRGFQTTGIFSLLTVYQVGVGGSILSAYSGMTIEVSGNTMTLTSVLTPGGFSSYQFTRR